MRDALLWQDGHPYGQGWHPSRLEPAHLDRGDLSAIESFFAPSADPDGILPDGQLGPEDLRALVPALRAMVRDLRIDIDRHREGDDWLWAQVTARALRATDMTPDRASGQVMMRFIQGQIVEAYNSFDFLTFFTQAGPFARGRVPAAAGRRTAGLSLGPCRVGRFRP